MAGLSASCSLETGLISSLPQSPPLPTIPRPALFAHLLLPSEPGQTPVWLSEFRLLVENLESLEMKRSE